MGICEYIVAYSRRFVKKFVAYCPKKAIPQSSFFTRLDNSRNLCYNTHRKTNHPPARGKDRA